MRTPDGYKHWPAACIEMAPSLQHRPELTHKDGYEHSRVDDYVALIERAELYLRWHAGRVTA